MGGYFEHLADVHDESAVDRRNVDPAAGADWTGLQPACVVLEQQGQEVPVGVRPDTLQVGAVGGPDVVDELAEPVRLAGEVLVEMVFR
jgi:hypothetical protein